MRILLALSALAGVVGQAATCTSYCTNIIANCVGANAVFTGTDLQASCMAECAFFAAATTNDTDSTATNVGNNLGCRDYHAGAPAAADAALHCPHARPDSTLCKSMEATTANLASGTCDNYCDQLKITCPTSLLSADRQGCINACARYTDQATPAGTFPIPSTASGDLGCRLYHVNAARTAAATHCPHADLIGGGVCPNTFCQIATSACTTAQTGYTDAASCMNIWKNIPAGAMADQSGDTQGCRAYHLSVAIRSAALATAHCNHTGQAGNAADGSAVCGTACDAYCSQYGANCSNTGYTSMATCKTACGNFAATGMRGAVSGNTLQCRLYHLGVAQQSAALSAEHCPHAAQVSLNSVCGAPAPAPTASASTAAVSILALAAPLLAFFRV